LREFDENIVLDRYIEVVKICTSDSGKNSFSLKYS